MHEMHWSWDQLQRTPVYVRRVAWDCIQARLDAERTAQERSGTAGDGMMRVKR